MGHTYRTVDLGAASSAVTTVIRVVSDSESKGFVTSYAAFVYEHCQQ